MADHRPDNALERGLSYELKVSGYGKLEVTVGVRLAQETNLVIILGPEPSGL
mgnify:CR=1 FL=1